MLRPPRVDEPAPPFGPSDEDRPGIVIAANRKAGSGTGRLRLARFIECLEERGFHVETRYALDDTFKLAEHERRAGRLHAVVAAGGDGTLNAALNGTSPDTPLAVFALGTENLMARYLQMPCDPHAAAEVVARRRLRRFDCGRAGERLFLLTLSVGFDADVVRRLSEVRTGNIGRLSYLAPIGRSLWNYRFPKLRVFATSAPNGEPARDPPAVCHWCFVQNLPAYAMRLNFTPDAVGDDGQLDYCLFERGALRHLPAYACAVARGRHRGRTDCRIGRAAGLRIESDAADVPVQVDGDPAGTLPIEVSTCPGRALLIVPPKLDSAGSFDAAQAGLP